MHVCVCICVYLSLCVCVSVYMCVCLFLSVCVVCVTGYWKPDPQNVTLASLLAQLIAMLIHYPCTVALTSLADFY